MLAQPAPGGPDHESVDIRNLLSDQKSPSADRGRATGFKL